jgi:hypothetical protein
VVFNPGGKDLLPLANYDLNIGALHKKYLTLHAAELWVETLVAQETMATIGGRVLVGPTTTLVADIDDTTTSIVVKHNQMADGDIVYLEAGGKVEFMEIDSAPAGTGPYTYSVIRNLDGTGANEWFAGDAVFNTGQVGKGFIDLYSVSGVDGVGAGPTIVGNVRHDETYNGWRERWAIGNLNGLYGVGSNDIYGVGLGDPTGRNILIDDAGGIRIRDATTQRMTVDATGLYLRNTDGDTVLELSTDGNFFALPMTLGANGGIWQGTGTFASPTTGIKLFRSGDTGVLASYNSTNEQIRIDTDGRFKAAAGEIVVDATGITFSSTVGNPTRTSLIWKDGASDYFKIGPVISVSTIAGMRIETFSNKSLAIRAPASNVIISGYSNLMPAPSLLVGMVATDLEGPIYGTKVDGQLYVTGDALVAGNINATGGASITGNTSINGQLSTTAGLTVAGHITSENDVRAASGISAGINSINIADGNILATGNFQRRVGTTNYSGYIYVPLASATTIFNASAQGAAGTATRTRAQLGVPEGAAAVVVRIMYQAAAGNTFTVSPVDLVFTRSVAARTQVNNVTVENSGVVALNPSSAALFLRWSAAGTLWLDIQGYFI